MAHDHDDDDLLDGCDIDFAEDPTSDEDLPYEVLFAGVKEQHGLFGHLKHHHAIDEKAEEWQELAEAGLGWQPREADIEVPEIEWEPKPEEAKS